MSKKLKTEALISTPTELTIADLYGNSPEVDATDFLRLYIDRKVFIKTVTFYWIGRLRGFTKDFMTLDTATWVPHVNEWEKFTAGNSAGMTGHSRYHPETPVNITRQSIIEFFEYPAGPLPGESDNVGFITRILREREISLDQPTKQAESKPVAENILFEIPEPSSTEK